MNDLLSHVESLPDRYAVICKAIDFALEYVPNPTAARAEILLGINKHLFSDIREKIPEIKEGEMLKSIVVEDLDRVYDDRPAYLWKRSLAHFSQPPDPDFSSSSIVMPHDFLGVAPLKKLGDGIDELCNQVLRAGEKFPLETEFAQAAITRGLDWLDKKRLTLGVVKPYEGEPKVFMSTNEAMLTADLRGKFDRCPRKDVLIDPGLHPFVLSSSSVIDMAGVGSKESKAFVKSMGASLSIVNAISTIDYDMLDDIISGELHRAEVIKALARHLFSLTEFKYINRRLAPWISGGGPKPLQVWFRACLNESKTLSNACADLQAATDINDDARVIILFDLAAEIIVSANKLAIYQEIIDDVIETE